MQNGVLEGRRYYFCSLFLSLPITENIPCKISQLHWLTLCAGISALMKNQEKNISCHCPFNLYFRTWKQTIHFGKTKHTEAAFTYTDVQICAYVQHCAKMCIVQYVSTLIKKKIKFSSYIRKYRVELLQTHIWLTASSYMVKYLRTYSCIRKPFLIYDFATAPLWISLCILGKFDFLLYQCTDAKYSWKLFLVTWPMGLVMGGDSQWKNRFFAWNLPGLGKAEAVILSPRVLACTQGQETSKNFLQHNSDRVSEVFYYSLATKNF